MHTFQTLLLREWMQHRFGWLVATALPSALFLVALAFGALQVQPDFTFDGDVPVALPVALSTIAALTVLTAAIAWLAVQIQAPGLARRDVQDRSIEFWLSLPVSAHASVGATLLVHLLLVPLAALAVGLAAGFVLSFLAVGREFGFAAWFSLPWGALLPAIVAVWLRLALGVVLASLWLAPLVLGAMASAAWLKRWGVPAFVATLLLGGALADQLWDSRIVWQALETLFSNARAGLFLAEPQQAGRLFADAADALAALGRIPGAMAADAAAALARLASPAFGLVLLCAAGGYALLVWVRSRGR